MKLDCFVSVVAPVQDGSANIEAFIRETISILQQNFKNYELVLIDDGSQDDSVEKIRRMLNDYSGFRLLRLSRRFGSDVAISAGLESVIGDYVVVMLPDMDPPNLIPPLVQRSMSGSDVVFGVQAGPSRQGWLYRTGSRLFHLYCQRVLRVKFPVNATQLRLPQPPGLHAINQIKDSHRYLRLYSAYVGYPQQEFDLLADLPGRSTTAAETPGSRQHGRRPDRREFEAPTARRHLARASPPRLSILFI